MAHPSPANFAAYGRILSWTPPNIADFVVVTRNTILINEEKNNNNSNSSSTKDDSGNNSYHFRVALRIVDGVTTVTTPTSTTSADDNNSNNNSNTASTTTTVINRGSEVDILLYGEEAERFFGVTAKEFYENKEAEVARLIKPLTSSSSASATAGNIYYYI